MAMTIELSDTQIAPEWDNFLAAIPGNHHAQTSRWGELKTLAHGRFVLLLERRDGDIAAGVQVLMRRVPLLGDIGYVARGPVLAEPDPCVTDALLQALHQLSRQLGLRYLLVQPPDGEEDLEDRLSDYDFSPSCFAPQPTATVRVDLQPDEETLFVRIKKRTRHLVRHGRASGLTVREGDVEDLPTFHQLLSATAERQEFTPPPLRYFESMWQLLAPNGWIGLFLVEHDGDPISAQLVIPFGDTVVVKSKGWSGNDSSLGPNQLLDWETMMWSKRSGFHYYDLEGIDHGLAVALKSGAGAVTPQEHGRTYFKLSYGGDVVLEPGGYEYLAPGIVRVAYEHVFRHALSPHLLDHVAARIRAQ